MVHGSGAVVLTAQPHTHAGGDSGDNGGDSGEATIASPNYPVVTVARHPEPELPF